MKIFAHRGFYGCTDIGQEYLTQPDVKGTCLQNYPPENSEISITQAFRNNFNVEIDVVLTQDREIIVTHTNELKWHSPDAKEGDFASTRTLSEILQMHTGLGGQTASYLTYKRFIEIFAQYPNATANVEIKGAIHPLLTMNELQNPGLGEKLAEATPPELFSRIIWSSFAISHLSAIKELRPDANTAMLFYPSGVEENPVYTDKDDRFMQFNLKNLKTILEKIPDLNAVHPCIDSVENYDLLNFCSQHAITVRPWILFERSPVKNSQAGNMIRRVKELQDIFPNLNFDIITDFPADVKNMLDL